MWGYAIFCEFPGCQRFEAVAEDGEIPAGWLSMETGLADVGGLAPDNVGTWCGWAHAVQHLLQLAPDDIAVDIRRSTLVQSEALAHRVPAGPT